MINAIGILLILAAIGILIWGIRYDEPGASGWLSRISIIGTSLLIGIMGYFLALTDKTICEIFTTLC